MAISSSLLSAATFPIRNSSNVFTSLKISVVRPSRFAKLHYIRPSQFSSHSRVFAALEGGAAGTSVLSVAADSDKVIIRPENQFTSSLWGDHFLSYVENEQQGELFAREVSKLKKILRHSLFSKESSVKMKIIMINNLERLGLAYHFEEEIEDELKQIFYMFYMIKDNGDYEDDDLFTVSLQFRLLRQHGYSISSGIFQRFKDPKSGGFKESLKSDTRGLLSLYEATFVRIQSDDILEEAINFTTIHLKSFKEKPTCPILRKEVEHALVQPVHRSMPRLEARHYISIYEDLDSKNENLLKLAKLDFNLLQMLHKKELRDLSRWWKELDIITKLGYPRDRLIEGYFFSLAAFYEPQHSVARIMLTKIVAMAGVIDDTYDAYGTIEELQLYTDAVQKWNVEEIDHLPNYMKTCYKALLDLFDDFEEELKEDGRSYAVNPSKEAIKQITQSYFIEAKWFIEGYSPSFAEYLRNGVITSGMYFLIPGCYLGMKAATEDVFLWLSQNPQILQPGAIIGRMLDDVGTYEVEKLRGQIMTPIECYMNEFGVTKEEAFLMFEEMAEDAWKEMNEECLKQTRMPCKFVGPMVNLVRLACTLYRYDEDGYTNPEKGFKNDIASMVIDPVPI